MDVLFIVGMVKWGCCVVCWVVSLVSELGIGLVVRFLVMCYWLC